MKYENLILSKDGGIQCGLGSFLMSDIRQAIKLPDTALYDFPFMENDELVIKKIKCLDFYYDAEADYSQYPYPIDLREGIGTENCPLCTEDFRTPTSKFRAFVATVRHFCDCSGARVRLFCNGLPRSVVRVTLFNDFISDGIIIPWKNNNLSFGEYTEWIPWLEAVETLATWGLNAYFVGWNIELLTPTVKGVYTHVSFLGMAQCNVVLNGKTRFSTARYSHYCVYKSNIVSNVTDVLDLADNYEHDMVDVENVVESEIIAPSIRATYCIQSKITCNGTGYNWNYRLDLYIKRAIDSVIRADNYASTPLLSDCTLTNCELHIGMPEMANETNYVLEGCSAYDCAIYFNHNEYREYSPGSGYHSDKKIWCGFYGTEAINCSITLNVSFTLGASDVRDCNWSCFVYCFRSVEYTECNVDMNVSVTFPADDSKYTSYSKTLKVCYDRDDSSSCTECFSISRYGSTTTTETNCNEIDDGRN